MTDSPPPHAELLDALPYIKDERRPSRFLPGTTALVPVFVCPGCGTRQEIPKHGVNFRCDGADCGLHMRLFGVNLHIWRDEKVTA